MTKHEKALKFLEDNIGEHEVPWPVPPGKSGSNTGSFVISCQRATWLAGTKWPWCCAAVIKAWTVAGFAVPWKGASAYGLLDWYRKNLPKRVVEIDDAKPGAAVIFNVGSGHVAMLAKPYSETKPNVVTVGGNEHDAVREVTRSVTLVRGVVDPIETGTVPAAKKPRVFEVVGSVSGHKKIVFVSGSKTISRKLPALLNHFGGITIRRRKT